VDCKTDPFLCTVDIAEAISYYDEMVLALLSALDDCNAAFVTPVDRADLFDIRHTGSIEAAKRAKLDKREFGDGGYYELPYKTKSGFFE